MSDNNTRYCYLNGEYLPLDQAQVSVLDRGFIFGDAIYEVIPASSGGLFALTDHLKRLQRNLDEVGIRNPMSDAQWRDVLSEVINLNGVVAGSVYAQVTRGVAERDHVFPQHAEPTVFVMFRAASVSNALAHVSAVTLDDNRWSRCDIKSTSLLPNVLLRKDRKSVV